MANVIQTHFLRAVLIGTLVLTFFVFRPFLYALILAAIFAVAFQPLYQAILGYVHGRRGLASLLTIVTATVAIFVPLIFLGKQIFQEANQLYFYLSGAGGKNAIIDRLDVWVASSQQSFPLLQNLSIDLEQLLKQGTAWLLRHLGPVFSGFVKLAVNFFIFLLALYYLLKDGERLKNAVVAISPLADIHDRAIIEKLKKAVNSVLKGSLLIALIQGVLTALGFTIFGLPNAVLWGSVSAVAALIPGLGTMLVLGPAIIILFIVGELFAATGLLVWGATVVGLVDNFLGPRLLGGDTELHPLLILLAVLGGIGFFGPIGFLLGPLTISLLFALIDIHLYFMKKKSS